MGGRLSGACRSPDVIRIRKGLDLPMAGGADPGPASTAGVSRVALVGADYVGLRPTMAVREGDVVTRGGLLFTDKKNPAVRFTSPGSGTVTAVSRGE